MSAGPLVDHFKLTLASGDRVEALGPLLHYERVGNRAEWGVAPLLSYRSEPDLELEGIDLFYPICTYHRFGSEYRLQLFQIISFSGGQTQAEAPVKRTSVFPFYFQQHSRDTNLNYTAVVPFYGEIKHRFYRDDIKFVMFPLYVQTRKKDVVTDNYLFPIFHRRHGETLSGWQVWPLAGYEHKGVTAITNSVGELETVGGHKRFFALWPLFFNQTTGIGTDNQERFQAVLPLYTWQRSPKRDSTTWLWPLITYTNDRKRKYREWDTPWPLIVFARGEGKTANRVWPFFSQVQSTNLESDFYLWPIYKHNRLKAEAVERERTRILFYLYSDTIDKSPGPGPAKMHRTDLWPLFTAWRDQAGSERLQVLALLEPFFPKNGKIERNYSPLWSIWRSEKNGETHAASQSFLWNLYRLDTAPTMRKCSLLFGLFQYYSGPEGRSWRLFYLPLGKAKGAGVTQSKG
ncbi:MAG: hypothetical protein M1608_01900 [Candidatus Omnitrophica bacterium]|nr:hypothetical protein [Candidatus Omnitrophota bacterium]